MTRSKKLFKKRKFCGNRYSLGENVCNENSEECLLVTGTEPINNEVPLRPVSLEHPPSSSKKKLSYLSKVDNNVGINALNSDSAFALVDLNQLSNLLCQFVKCKFCNCENTVMLSEDANKSVGLASNLVLKCSNCQENDRTMSSKITKNRLYEINMRFVYALRSIGKGVAAAKTLCAVLNLPQPPLKFSRYNDLLLNALSFVTEASMVNAAHEAVKENNGSSDIAAVFDGTWQKRGHTSLNGVITATSFDTGKVVDVECLTKFCHGCIKNPNKKVEHQTNCLKNHEGSSGAMECNGVLKIFQRSEEKRGVRYIKYLGDGDSKGFQHVQSEKPYGDTTIEKLECIGHVQKRVGTRLRRMKNTLKGTVLSDGKGLGGKGRLTDSEIDQLQRYYGLAIRRNIHDQTLMKKEIWAIFYHKLSTDTHPQHQLCPKGPESWCRYNKAQESNETYSHKHALPLAVMESIKPVFQDLSKPELLRKCLHGKTQNPNESLNHVIWSRVPKTTFVGLKSLRIGVYDAILTFNEGAMGKARVFQELAIQPGKNMVKALRQIDELRVAKAEKEAESVTKEARVKRRHRKRKREEEESKEDCSYGPGEF